MDQQDVLKNWEEVLDAELAGSGSIEPSTTPAMHTGDPGAGRQLCEKPRRDTELAKQQIYAAIRHGRPLPVDIYDEEGRFLLGAGSRITPEFLQLLRNSGIAHVRFQPAPTIPLEGAEVDDDSPISPEDLYTDRSCELDERLAGELLVPVRFRSVAAWRRPRLSVAELKREAGRGIRTHSAAANAVAELCETLKSGKRISAPQLSASIDEFLQMAAVDFDLLPLIVAMQESKDEYLFDHCVNVSVLSMAMASQMGLDREQTVNLALGGLLADIGMLRVPLSIRMAPRALTPREWHEIHRHPIHTLDMLADIRGIPQVVKFIVYQVHERSNGDGYPRGRKDHHLHSFAKIIAVADAYAAMTRARPHRPAMTSYEAAKTLLFEGAENKYDRQMIRVLLDTISLFPIGSKVTLSNGMTARVLRAVPGLHTRPVVEELASDGTPTGHIIDLSQTEDMRVVSAVA